MKEIILDIPQEYSFLLERYYFEYNRAIQNVVFLLNKHSEEIDFINKQGTDEKNEWYKCQLERLQKIINGEYS